MTEEEAKRAAATFEFPGFRAEAQCFTLTAWPYGHREFWWLKVTGAKSDDPRYFPTTAGWLAAWANMQAGRAYFDDGALGIGPLDNLRSAL